MPKSKPITEEVFRDLERSNDTGIDTKDWFPDCRDCGEKIGTGSGCAECSGYLAEVERLKDRIFSSPRFVDCSQIKE